MRRLLGAALLAALGYGAPAVAQSPDAEGSGSPIAADPAPAVEASEPAAAPDVLDWPELRDQVMTSAPTVLIAESQLQQSETRRLEAWMASLPSFTARAGLSPAPTVDVELDDNGNPIQGTADESDLELATRLTGMAYQASFELNLPLFTFGKLSLARQLASAGVDVEEAELRKAVLDALFETYRAFVGVQWYREVDRLLTEAEDRLDEAAQRLDDAIFDGDASARQSLRQLRIARTDFVELRASADEVGALARFALARGLQRSPDFTTTRFDEDLPVSESPNLEQALEFARQRRPDYRLLDSAVEAARLRARLEVRQFAPDLGFVLGVNATVAPTITDLRGPFVFDPYNRFGVSFALGLRWNLNIFTRAASVSRYNEAAAEAVLSRDAAWLGIEIEVAEAWHQAVSKRDVLLSYVDAMDAAESWLNQTALQYDQGLIDFDDFREPLTTWYETRGGYYRALLEYRLAVANLAVKCGSDELTVWPGTE
jgi:outer membrane protein TolC